LEAERRERDAIRAELQASLLSDDAADAAAAAADGSYGKEWAAMEEARDELRRGAEEVRVERAHDRAVARYDRGAEARRRRSEASVAAAPTGGDGKEYQFVGVVNPASKEKGVTWYARPKPAGSKWSVRMVHVDRDAVIRDMFTSGKVDVYGEYVNKGRKAEEEGQEGSGSGALVLEGKYTVKERSWKTLWNFNPLHVFTDSSGMYWRERRLTPGLYTDGRAVYESTYRYSDGKNGMRPVASLESYVRSGNMGKEEREELERRLREEGPDVVAED